MEVSLRRENKLVVGQKMYQSMSFLQMNAEELADSMHTLCMENPLVEELPPEKSVDRLIDRCGGRVKQKNGEDMELPIPDKRRNTLRSDLMDQAAGMKLSKRIDECLKFLIINLDSKGYLLDDLRYCVKWKSDPEGFEKARELLRSMEPAGVGAADLADCLCIQLERRGEADSLAYKICRDYLDHLSRNHINHIAKAMSVTEDEVRKAKETIVSLHPIPSNGYDDGCDAAIIIPDVEIEEEEGRLFVMSMDPYMPSYKLDQAYIELSNSDEISDEDRVYFREKISEAQWAISCVKRRRETLLRCAEAIAEEQREFFVSGGEMLRPCSMAAVADKLGIHPSTVSRAVRDKYLICKWGVFPISRFFAREVNGDTQTDISLAMKKIIAGEDKRKPLSDQMISERLYKMGFDISRRTVAKYRDVLDIPPATGRKIAAKKP